MRERGFKEVVRRCLRYSPADAGRQVHKSTRSPERTIFSLRHQTILTTSTQLPFSAVVETYTNQVLDFGPWAAHLSTDARP